jgi:GTP-binding protein
MKFVDYVTLTVRSGKGGAGASTFRREKYEPRGGPNGGDGGSGGSVVLTADSRLYTLLDLRYNRHHFAGDGKRGEPQNKTGKDGDDIVLRVPVGTVVRDALTGDEIGEVLEDGDTLILAQGGKGGLGNWHFRSSTRQAPTYAQPGLPGEEREVQLELKLLADVGLVGFPNAGKSTLVSSLSAAKPKIADYPFTTLEPSLGVVQVDDWQTFVIADIPGIIEGASEGKGLGHRFLKHIERNAVLLFVISAEQEDAAGVYRTLLAELEAFEPDLLDKPRAVALSKMDLWPPDTQAEFAAEVRASLPDGIALYPISSVARTGLDELKRGLWSAIEPS